LRVQSLSDLGSPAALPKAHVVGWSVTELCADWAISAVASEIRKLCALLRFKLIDTHASVLMRHNVAQRYYAQLFFARWPIIFVDRNATLDTIHLRDW